jgi:hypothetical protein
MGLTLTEVSPARAARAAKEENFMMVGRKARVSGITAGTV